MRKVQLKIHNVENDGEYKKTLTLINEQEMMIYEKNVLIGEFNKTEDGGEIIKSPEEKEKREFIKEFFGVDFEDLDTLVDTVVKFVEDDANIYYKEFTKVNKLDPNVHVEGDLLDELKISEIELDKNRGLKLLITDGEHNYKISGFSYEKYDKKAGRYFKNAKKIEKVNGKINKFFTDDLTGYVGSQVLVEVKKYNDMLYLELKKVTKK